VADYALGHRVALLLFIVVFLLRISVAAQFRGNYDSASFLLVADAVLDGKAVYAATDRYNYSPLWSYVLALVRALSRPNANLFILLLGVLQTAVDVGSAWLVFRIARRLEFSPSRSRRAALLFFSNPVSVLVSNAHGQFDGVAIFFLLAAALVALAPGSSRRQWRVAVFLGCSLIVKHLALFHPIVFWRRVRRPGLSDAALATPYAMLLFSFLPFVSLWPSILRNVFLYPAGASPGRARPGFLQSYLNAPGVSRFVFGLALLSVLAFVVIATRHVELPRACLLVSLSTLLFLPNYSDQYLVWPIAFGSLYASPAFGLFSSVAGLWYWGGSLRAPLPIATNGAGAWVAALLWFVLEVGRARRDRGSVSPSTRPRGASPGSP
jgi:hypothetical protein